MTDQMDFSLPNDKPPVPRTQSGWQVVLLCIVIIAVLADMGLQLLHSEYNPDVHQKTMLPKERQKQLALKLEKQGLKAAAVDAWRKYLETAGLSDAGIARIWYRIGKLYQADTQYDQALYAYYRSEGFAELEDIGTEIARRTQECLEKMGKFAVLRYELADRVGKETGPAKGAEDQKDPVVAEIGPGKIRKSELDRKVEHMIDTQLAPLADYLSQDQYNERKEAISKQYANDRQRQRFLNQFIMEEVLYREARERGLMDKPEIRVRLTDLEQAFLAGEFLEDELSRAIKITPTDLETYYEAHTQKYVQPERAKISQILVDDHEKAEMMRKRLQSGEKFSSLAAAFSRDAASQNNNGEIKGWVENRAGITIAGIQNAESAVRAIFSTKAGQVAEEDVASAAGIHIIKVREREPKYQKTLDAVKDEIYQTLRGIKEEEVRQRLFERLSEKYDVVIHASAFTAMSDGSPYK